MKRYWSALLVIIVSALLYQLIGRFLPAKFSGFLDLLWMILLLVIGYYLAPHAKKNNRWLGKVVIAIFVVFIVAYRMNFFVIPEFTNLLNLLGLTGNFLDLLLIYCGWAFFQV
ncbi:MAG: hypothetical protein RR565_00730 [Erysipelothrix sp.]